MEPYFLTSAPSCVWRLSGSYCYCVRTVWPELRGLRSFWPPFVPRLSKRPGLLSQARIDCSVLRSVGVSRDTDCFVLSWTSGAKRLVRLLCCAHTRLGKLARKRVTRGWNAIGSLFSWPRVGVLVFGCYKFRQMWDFDVCTLVYDLTSVILNYFAYLRIE
jgi:hypothetical protein